MTIRNKMTLATLVALGLGIGAVQAAEPGFYVGASGGQTTIDLEAGDTGFDISDDDMGWKAYLGYNFLPWLGVEGGYVDFGNPSDSFPGNIDAQFDMSGWDAFLVGILPLGNVDLFAKVGAIELKADLDTKAFGSEDESDTQFAYGVGMAYNIGHWGLRLEAEGFDDNEVDDFYFLSAGVTYRFGGDEPAAAPVAAAPVAAAPAACADEDGDGVCDTDDQCKGTTAGARVGPYGCNCDYRLQLEFAFDSATLTANDMAALDAIVPILSNPKAGSIGGTVVGHTDSVGDADYNQRLSLRRAESVAKYLESKGAQLQGRFSIDGLGETAPVASNDTSAGRAQNRRVEVSRTDCAAQ